jgi:hypothetical protein
MTKSEILDSIKYQISRLRDDVYKAGDKADIVYIGEDIGKLYTAFDILLHLDIDWKERPID